VIGYADGNHFRLYLPPGGLSDEVSEGFGIFAMLAALIIYAASLSFLSS
jgi:hypothetical protein